MALDLTHLKVNEQLLQKALDAFVKNESLNLTPVYELLEERYSYDELRLARLALRSQGAINAEQF